MANELEVKVLEVDVPSVIARLEKMGAKKVFDDDVYALKYDSKFRPITKDEVLRLRKIGKEVEFTYKKKIAGDGIKANDETEVFVDSFDNMNKILEVLGFTVKQRVDKRRVTYKLGKEKCEFDTIIFPIQCPTYLELEAGTPERLQEMIGQLGYTMKDTVDWSEAKVVEYYSKFRRS